jgi:hypothetical protein
MEKIVHVLAKNCSMLVQFRSPFVAFARMSRHQRRTFLRPLRNYWSQNNALANTSLFPDGVAVATKRNARETQARRCFVQTRFCGLTMIGVSRSRQRRDTAMTPYQIAFNQSGSQAGENRLCSPNLM